MADETAGGEDGGAAAEQENRPQFAMRAQYIKDLSFENPNAPDALGVREQPKFEISVTVNGRPLGNDNHEVELQINARALHDEKVTFLAELTYAGVFFIKNVPDEQIRPAILIQGPSLLFPFARRVLADCTREGGFPPLMLDPIDFLALYRQSEEANQQAATPEPTIN